MRITTTVGFVATLVVGVWFVGRWTDQIEDASTNISAEIQALQVILDDVADRQTENPPEDHDAQIAEALKLLAEAMAAPKQIVRDESGKAVGIENA